MHSATFMASISRSLLVAAGGAAIVAVFQVPSTSMAQDNAFDGYVRSGGMVSGGPATQDGASGGSDDAEAGQNDIEEQERSRPQYAPDPDGPRDQSRADGLPGLATGRETNETRQRGFNEAIQEAFPMTPEMIQRYREIFAENQRAMLEREEPRGSIETGLISLEPGEEAPTLTLAQGIASVVGFYDATGAPWPVDQYVLGDGDDFQIIQLGSNANNLSVTPLTPVGWTNLIVMLEGEDTPVVARLQISDNTTDYRRDIQVMRNGPNAEINTATQDSPEGRERQMQTVRDAGNSLLVSALSGVDLPDDARELTVTGVGARAWLVDDQIVLRSNDALLSPQWTSSMSGPNGTRVYVIEEAPMALFSVSGQIVRADIELP